MVGALSFLGSRLATHLSGGGWEVTAVSQVGDISPQRLTWYRKEQLANAGLEVKILNFSNETLVSRFLKAVRPSHVVYIPPGLDSPEDHPHDTAAWSQYLTGFVVLLEALRRQSSCTHVLLASKSKHSSVINPTSSDSHMAILRAWMESFELTLTAYHHLYSYPITMLRIDGLYGPWGSAALSMLRDPETADPVDLAHSLHICWYVGDVVWAFQSALRLSSNCEVLDIGPCSRLTPDTAHSSLQSIDDISTHSWEVLKMSTTLSLSQGVRKSLSWARSYTQHPEQRELEGGRGTHTYVIFTSYFTTSEDSQRSHKKSPDRFQYMLNWFLGVKELKLKAIVFHDGLDPKFRHRVRQHYSGVSFHLVPSLQNRSTNDARFYAYLSYLDSHPEIGHVLLTDISDVSFLRNPFDLMTLLGHHWLYIGTDIDIFPNMQAMPWIHERLQGCFGNYSVSNGELHPLMNLDTVYNAGVIGGSRETIMATLHWIVQYLDSTPPHLNCNMPAVNFAIHKHFFDKVFTGFPLTSRFLRRQTAPKGVFIVHK